MGYSTIVEFLAKKGFQIDSEPNTKLTAEMYDLLVKEYQGEKEVKNKAKKLGDLSYKGGSVSVESVIDTGTCTAIKRGKEKANGITKKKSKNDNGVSKVEREIQFYMLRFGPGFVSKTYKRRHYIYRDHRIKNFDKILGHIYNSKLFSKAEKRSIRTAQFRVEFDIEAGTLSFKDIDICNYVNNLKDSYIAKKKEEELRKEILLKNKDKKENQKKPNSSLTVDISLSELEFDQGHAFITYENRRYICNDYDIILEKIYGGLSKAEIKSSKAPHIKVVIDIETKSFYFFNEMWRQSLNVKTTNSNNGIKPKNKKIGTLVEIPSKSSGLPQKSSSALKTITLGAGNIRFFNGYYLIFHTNNGEIDNSVVPCRVNDLDSTETLNLVHKYFEQKLEQSRIFIKYDETKVLEPLRLDLFKLSKYIKTLKRNLDIKGEWWDEVQNYRKPSLAQCRSIPTDVVKKKVSLKSGYLDILCSMQNEEKLNRVYEVNHGKEEEAFIFTISMANNRYAVIFENASNDASTTTWVFVTKKENYEPCVNLVFDYFTDYTIVKKRSSLRDKTVNPPEKFKAESYTFIDHDDLGQWLKKLNKILEQTLQPSKIEFVSGLQIPQSSETRSGHGDTITTKHLHNQLMRKLYDKLCIEHGKDNVGTENHVGTKRIDAVVKCGDYYDIYEIKTATDPIDCVKEALGQLFIYSYLNCSDNIGKMVIVGSSEATKEFEQHLSTIRKNHSLQLYYMKV